MTHTLPNSGEFNGDFHSMGRKGKITLNKIFTNPRFWAELRFFFGLFSMRYRLVNHKIPMNHGGHLKIIHASLGWVFSLYQTFRPSKCRGCCFSQLQSNTRGSTTWHGFIWQTLLPCNFFIASSRGFVGVSKNRINIGVFTPQIIPF